MKKSIVMFLLMFLFFGCSEQQQNKVISASLIDTASLIKKDTIAVSNISSASIVMEDFATFWKTFREAVLSYDTAQLMNLTVFPLEYRGTLDDDPVVKISQNQFAKIFSLFLNQWHGGDLEGTRELDYVKKIVNPSDQAVNGEISVGNMVFYEKDGKWKLGFLYLNNETMRCLENDGH